MTHLTKWKIIRKIPALFLAVLCLASQAGAHKGEKADEHKTPRTGTGGIHTAEDKILDSVGFDQKLDNQLPLGLEFKDESGKTVQLRQYFGEKPVIILPIYYRCGTLCPIGAEEMLRSLKQIKPAIGQEYQIVTLSIDPKEGPELAAETKKRYVTEYKRDDAKTAAGWHFLTGKHEAIDELCDAIGFRYAYVPKTGEYAHPDGIVMATPEGKVARYFYRLDYPPRDIQFGLMEAASERIGSPLQYLALSCFHYDPTLGKYNVNVMKVLRLFSAFFVVLCLSVIAFVVRLERKNERKLEQAEASVGAQPVVPL
ncbi:MAG TPA: SCO family protein [Abditibacteriaceae bacterium]|jgi:protein SCO1/2